MKPLVRMLRRYVVTAVVGVLLFLVVNLALFLGVVFYYGREMVQQHQISQIARMVTEQDGAVTLDTDQPLSRLLDGWVWGMVLDDHGRVIWRYQLPAELDRTYTIPEAVSFSRWYLEDYPVMSYRTDCGLLVLGMPKNSISRYNFYIDNQLFDTLIHWTGPVLALELLAVLLACLAAGWRTGRAMGNLEQGIEALAAGRTVQLAERGLTADLARKLNAASSHLTRQNRIIARRDTARTNWIAGVSHDIRTPLALIMGYAEQMEAEEGLTPEDRKRAGAIRTQSLRIKALIEDLNLTSKLQYNAQPLRLTRCRAGTLLRRAVSDFCNDNEGREVALEMDRTADQAVLRADEAMLRRAFANLLGNSARHNPQGCTIRVRARMEMQEQPPRLGIVFSDMGRGFPPAVLAVLQGRTEADGEQPHILGLHLVQQIVAAHGGRTVFGQNQPHGAAVTLYLPLADPEDADAET